jgi:hypothetical protein
VRYFENFYKRAVACESILGSTHFTAACWLSSAAYCPISFLRTKIWNLHTHTTAYTIIR